MKSFFLPKSKIFLAEIVSFDFCLTPSSGHLGSEPAVLSLRGVECMNDDPSKVDVLYAKVSLTDGSDRSTTQHTLIL